MTITELRRVGANVLEATPVKFEWDSQHHSMIQGTMDLELQINTNREVPAGAQEPIEQVMSVEWTPIDVHGEWKDQWAGEGFAHQTMIEFGMMCGRVPLVRIELGPHALVGLITSFRIKWQTKFEIGYGFKFSIHRNETFGPFGSAPITDLSSINFSQRIQDQRDALARIDSVVAVAQSLPLATEDLDLAVDNMSDLRSSVNNAQFATDAVAFEDAGKQDFSEIVDRTQHKLLSIAAAFSGIRTQAQQNQADVQSLISTDVLAYNDVIATLKFEEWTRTQTTELAIMIGAARASEIDARDRAARRPRGIHRVRRGDTLDRISMKWYGNPDSSRLIRDANALDSIVLVDGSDLIIPDVSR